jgi:transposase
MIRVTLSDSEKKELRKNRFLHPDPEVQRRSDILLLCAYDISHEKVAEIFACHRNTITNVLHRYHANGLPGLMSLPRPGRRSELTPHVQNIAESLEKNPVRSVNEACERIKEITGIVRKPTQVRGMLHHLGFRRLMSGAMPCPPKKSRKNMQWIRTYS